MMPVSLFQHIKDHIDQPLPIIRSTKKTLVHLSHALEDIVLRDKMPALIFTGFQESSHWRKETERYHQLAEVAHRVCIFAGQPLPPESSAKQLHIELANGDSLRQEWFLMILTERFSALLCGQDAGITPSEEATREFDTIFAFDPVIINPVLDALESAIAAYRPERLADVQEARRRFPPITPASDILTGLIADLIHFEETLNRQLWQNNLLTNTLLEAISYAVYIVEATDDDHFKTLYSSPRHYDLFGRYFPDSGHFDLLGGWIHPDDQHVIIAREQQPLNVPIRLEYRVLHEDGHYVWVEDSLTARANPLKEGIIFYGIVRDITAEHELRAAQEALIRTELSVQKEREVSSVKRYLITTVMHEFRTPLATILTASELLERYGDRMEAADRSRRFAQIKSEVVGLRSLLDDLTMILSDDPTALGFVPEPRPIKPAFKVVIDEYCQQYRETIAATYADAMGSALLDQRLIRYIVPNMLRNAARFASSESSLRVELSLHPDDEQIHFDVYDDSLTGDADTEANGTTGLFLRASNVGAGLGLYIALECAQRHNGDLLFESSPEIGGSRLRLVLPLLRD